MMFLLSPIGRGLAMAGVAVVAFTVWLVAHDHKIATQAADKAVKQIGKANDKAVEIADRARAASRNSGVRGKRDPHTLD